MSLSANYPAIKPTLLLDFANTKMLDSRITFTRASTATYYDGVTTTKAEENLFTYSQEFDNAAWTVLNTSVTANSTTAPDGTSTAELVAETVQLAGHSLYQATLATSGLAYTMSVFAKKGTGATAPNIVQLTFGSAGFGTGQYANFNINTGALGTVTGGTATITSVGNSWYRLTFTATATASASSNNAAIVFTNNNDTLGRAPSYTGVTTSDVFIWGAQLEQRSSVTAYTATTTQPITNYIPTLRTAAAGVARFTHNPITGESLGLLVEESRTNLVTYSQEFNNAFWQTASNVTVETNQIIAPDGTLTADLLREAATTETHRLSANNNNGITITDQVYTLTVYAKAGSSNWVSIRLTNSATNKLAYIWVNLATGSIGTTTSTGSTGFAASVTSVGNGWYRCSVSGNVYTAGDPRIFAYVANSLGDGDITYAGSTTQFIYIWGAQLEAGAFPTSYISTSGATATRSQDTLTMAGANFSSWYRQDEGTFFLDAVSPPWSAGGVSVAPAVITVNNGGGNYRIYFGRSATTARPFINVTAGGTTQVDLVSSTTAWAASTGKKLAGVFKVNDFAVDEDGATVQTDTLGTVPEVNQLLLGARGDGPIWNGTIKKIAFYPLRVTNAQLQALTS